MIPESQISQIIDAIIQREGGYSDDPTDRGGETNFGITQSTLDGFNRLPVTDELPGIHMPRSVKDLTHDTAAYFYRCLLRSTKIDQVPDYATLNLVADCAVNHGSGKAAQWLQDALGVTSDGVIGPQTIGMMAKYPQVTSGPVTLDIALPPTNWRKVYNAILASRFKFYAAIVHNDPAQSRFIQGWISRACEFLA